LENAMPRRKQPPPTVTLDSAIAGYCAAFGSDALPCLYGIGDAAEATAVAMLNHAVARKRPLPYCAVAEAAGLPQPPMHGAL
jgi:hypothetical protein